MYMYIPTHTGTLTTADVFWMAVICYAVAITSNTIYVMYSMLHGISTPLLLMLIAGFIQILFSCVFLPNAIGKFIMSVVSFKYIILYH